MLSKSRILYIATFPPPIHGSAMVSLQIKNSKLINDEFNGDYINISTSRSMDEIGNNSLFYLLQKLGRFVINLFNFLRKLLTHRYSLCYCAITIRGNCFLRDTAFVLLCKMFGYKVVIHQHNKGMSEYVDKPIFRWLYPLVYKNTKVILLSWRLYPDIEKVVKREQVLICPNGIPDNFKTEPFFERKNKIPKILFLSNLLVDKGVLVLLDALKILKERGYSFMCDFVGGESKDIDAKRFEKEVKERDLKSVAFYKGKKYGYEKACSFASSDMFVLPSKNEAFPLTILEAMEYKLPIITSNVGGIPDMVEDGINGFVIPKQDADALANAMEQLLVNFEIREQMGKAGRKKFEEQFTEEQFEKCMLQCLKESMKN